MRYCIEEFSHIPHSVFFTLSNRSNYQELQKKAQCCFVDKRRLHKILNVVVPIIVTHTVLFKKYIFVILKNFIKKNLFKATVSQLNTTVFL